MKTNGDMWKEKWIPLILELAENQLRPQKSERLTWPAWFNETVDAWPRAS